MTKPTLEEIKEVASRYPTKMQFKNAHSRLYSRAYHQGWLDEISGHMEDARIKWTKQKLQAEAKKHSSRSVFARENPNAYQAARSRGMLDEVCRHMDPTLDTLYLLRITGTDIFKVGLTSEHFGLQRLDTLRKQLGRPMDLLLYAPIGDHAQILEQELHRVGDLIHVEGVKSREFREYSFGDLSKVVNCIMSSILAMN